MEDNLRWKTIFSGRRSSVEDDHWWKRTFGGRQPSLERLKDPKGSVRPLKFIEVAFWGLLRKIWGIKISKDLLREGQEIFFKLRAYLLNKAFPALTCQYRKIIVLAVELNNCYSCTIFTQCLEDEIIKEKII